MSNMRYNKKGLSNVIATVIFIVLILASIALIVPSIFALVKQPGEQLSPFVSCTKMQASPSTIESARYNAESGNLEVTVKRSAINEINSFTFVLQGSIESERFDCGPTCGGSCNLQSPGEEKTFHFPTEDIEQVVLYANGNCLLDSREVS